MSTKRYTPEFKDTPDLDLREVGERCGKHRIARLMQIHNIKAVRGYKTLNHPGGRPSLIAPNKLQRAFTVDQADAAWVTDITYIRTWQGWLYLAIVLDLFSRKIVGWSMKPTLAKEIVLDALVMAEWRRRPHAFEQMLSETGYAPPVEISIVLGEVLPQITQVLVLAAVVE